jgi:hypothetical protein
MEVRTGGRGKRTGKIVKDLERNALDSGDILADLCLPVA